MDKQLTWMRVCVCARAGTLRTCTHMTSCWICAPEVILKQSEELHDRNAADDKEMSHQPTRCFNYIQAAAASRTNETRHWSRQLAHSTLIFQLSA